MKKKIKIKNNKVVFKFKHKNLLIIYKQNIFKLFRYSDLNINVDDRFNLNIIIDDCECAFNTNKNVYTLNQFLDEYEDLYCNRILNNRICIMNF